MEKKCTITFVLVLIFASILTVSAETLVLARVGDETYVKSEHADDFFADTYDGTVSVKGTDWFYNGSYTAYPTYSKITYDVQGTKYVKQVNSTGKTDSNTKTGTITVKDKWNFGPKTQMYGDIGQGFASNTSPYHIDNNGSK